MPAEYLEAVHNNFRMMTSFANSYMEDLEPVVVASLSAAATLGIVWLYCSLNDEISIIFLVSFSIMS